MKLLKFETSHCGMCKAMGQMLDNANIKYTKVDAEERTDLAEEFGIRNVPTLIKLRDDGTEIGRCGFVGREELISFCKL